MSALAKTENAHASLSLPWYVSAVLSGSFKCPAVWDSSSLGWGGGGDAENNQIKRREKSKRNQISLTYIEFFPPRHHSGMWPIQPHPFLVLKQQLSGLWFRFPLTDSCYRSRLLGHGSSRCMWFRTEKSIDFIYAATNSDISTHCPVIYKANLASELLYGCCPATRIIWLRF